MPNHVEDKSVADTKKFVEKICPHVTNKKRPFGSTEVRVIFDHLLRKYGSIEKIPLPELRTFTLAVFQHKTFCRFSDIEKITLSDVLFHTDYFKIKISSSKTDQGGKGQQVFLTGDKNGFLDPHMLLCVYMHRMSFDNHAAEVYLFPPLKWAPKACEYGLLPKKSLSYPAAYKSFKTLLTDAGLVANDFGLHSPRSGGATDAFYNNIPLYLIDLQGRWKSSSSKYGYLRLDETRLAQSIKHSSRY